MQDPLESYLRRRLLQAGGAAVATAMLSGCRSLFVAPLPPCSTAPSVAPNASPGSGVQPASDSALTIDVHVHIFNGTDLQVRQFIERNTNLDYDPALKNLAGALIQDLSWSLAPTAQEETRELAELAKCSGIAAMKDRIEAHRENAFRNARNALRKTKTYREYMQGRNRSKAGGPPAGAQMPEVRVPGAAAANQQLRQQHLQRLARLLAPATRAGYKTVKAQAPLALELAPQAAGGNAACNSPTVNIDGLVDFIIQGFQYRFVSFEDYLDTYTPAADSASTLTTAPSALAAQSVSPNAGSAPSQPARTIDLAIANLVDYDWPLAKGARTRSSLRDQIRVMASISELTNGRVHGFIPYDPMKQVAIRAKKRPAKSCWFSPRGSELPFDDLAQAVMTGGCIGVKMYPPMGFLPLGNALLLQNTWKVDWLPDWMAGDVTYPEDGTRKSFGERLDEELDRLYAWAIANDVPITAHAENTNGASALFEGFALYQGWGTALEKYKSLRINFAHTGDITACPSGNPATNGTPGNARNLIGLFGNVPGGAGQFAYCDLSYGEGILEDETQIGERLLALFRQTPPSGSPNPSSRMMYGTDWFFLIEEANYAKYFQEFTAMLNAIDRGLSPSPAVTARIFGWNAVDWLGLRKGEPTRQRLEAFYCSRGMDLANHPPQWMRKIESANA